jgi:hypothetical protein
MNRPYQLKELMAAYWLGCLTVLIQTCLAARYVPYDALPDEAATSAAAHLVRNAGRVAAFATACASLFALSLAKRVIKRGEHWQWRWLLPCIAAYGWSFVFLPIFQARVNSQRQMLTPLLTVIHPSLGVDLILATVRAANAYSIPAFLVFQFFCLIIIHAFCQPIAVDPEDTRTE